MSEVAKIKSIIVHINVVRYPFLLFLNRVKEGLAFMILTSEVYMVFRLEPCSQRFPEFTLTGWAKFVVVYGVTIWANLSIVYGYHESPFLKELSMFGIHSKKSARLMTTIDPSFVFSVKKEYCCSQP